jgi:hypothetical protein
MMPTIVENLFREVIGKVPDGCVIWGEPISNHLKGIYVVESKYPISVNNIFDDAIAKWIERAPHILVDQDTPSIDIIKERLSQFIYPDETVLYIGQTGAKISRRVRSFYVHTLGNRSPHRGGHWIKTLNASTPLEIHFAAVDNPNLVENEMLNYYINHVSKVSEKLNYDPNLLLPFANLTFNNQKKHHGFNYQSS